MSTVDRTALAGRTVLEVANWRPALYLVFPALAVALAACEGPGAGGPAGPSGNGDVGGYRDVKAAIECVEDSDGSSWLSSGGRYCSEETKRWGLCSVNFSLRFTHTCSEGWPPPHTSGTGAGSAGDIRVLIALSAFRGGDRFATGRMNEVFGVGVSREVSGSMQLRDEDVPTFPDGEFQISYVYRACWLEVRPTQRGAGCYPDIEYPPYPATLD